MPDQIDPETGEITQEPAVESTTYFNSLDQFVRDFVCPVFRRNVGEPGRAEHRWSAQWWKSSEAIIRLEAIWRTFEQARQDPTGMSAWLRDHADYHLNVLMSPNGPFANSHESSTMDKSLPYERPPEGLF